MAIVKVKVSDFSRQSYKQNLVFFKDETSAIRLPPGPKINYFFPLPQFEEVSNKINTPAVDINPV